MTSASVLGGPALGRRDLDCPKRVNLNEAKVIWHAADLFAENIVDYPEGS